MFPPGTTLRVTPGRLEQLQRGDGPWPLTPPSWEILTSARWPELRERFGFPDIVRGVAVRAYLECTCVGLIESRREAKPARSELNDGVIRWMSKASNIGKPLEIPVGEGVINYLSYIAEKLNEGAGRIIAQPHEFTAARTLTIPMQLCALVLWDLAGHSRRPKRTPPPIIEFYAALWRTWEEYLGPQVTLWAHEGGRGASAFVQFVTCLLRWSGEPMSHDDAIAWKNVRTRLSAARRLHTKSFEPHGPTAVQELVSTVSAAPVPEWRLRLRRRTRQSGFSRSRRRA